MHIRKESLECALNWPKGSLLMLECRERMQSLITGLTLYRLTAPTAYYRAEYENSMAVIG
jgi:hypothetical protein